MDNPDLRGIRTAKDLEEALEAAGWRLLRQSKHSIYGCPCGQHKLTVAVSASDWRAVRNSASTLRRLLRECPTT